MTGIPTHTLLTQPSQLEFRALNHYAMRNITYNFLMFKFCFCFMQVNPNQALCLTFQQL